jgi:hypothetical protein
MLIFFAFFKSNVRMNKLVSLVRLEWCGGIISIVRNMLQFYTAVRMTKLSL